MFIVTTKLDKDQVRLAYVLCKALNKYNNTIVHE